MVEINMLTSNEILIAELKSLVIGYREEHPAVASLILGAIIAVKMNRTPELARLIKEFSKSLVDEKSTRKIEPERQEICNLLLKIEAPASHTRNIVSSHASSLGRAAHNSHSPAHGTTS